MIQLKDLDKYMESRFQRIFILKGINLTINEGGFITLIGSSGAVKFSLLNILGLLDVKTMQVKILLEEKVSNS